MSFFRINLNRLEDPNVALRKERRGTYVFFVLAALFAGLAAAAVRYDGDLSAKLRELRLMKAGLTAQIEAMEKDSAYVSEEDVRALHGLEQGRVFWTNKLTALAELAGEKIVLTRVQYGGIAGEAGAPGPLTLQGIADTGPAANKFELVSAFIDRLQASPEFARDFRKVEFLSSRRLDFQDQNLLSFSVLCLPR